MPQADGVAPRDVRAVALDADVLLDLFESPGQPQLLAGIHQVDVGDVDGEVERLFEEGNVEALAVERRDEIRGGELLAERARGEVVALDERRRLAVAVEGDRGDVVAAGVEPGRLDVEEARRVAEVLVEPPAFVAREALVEEASVAVGEAGGGLVDEIEDAVCGRRADDGAVEVVPVCDAVFPEAAFGLRAHAADRDEAVLDSHVSSGPPDEPKALVTDSRAHPTDVVGLGGFMWADHTGHGMTDDSEASRRLWLVAISWFVAVDALGFQLRGALLPELQREFTVSESLLGLVAPAGTLGFLVVLLVFGAIAGRVDLRKTMLAGVVSVGLAIATIGVAPTFGVFLVALLVRGILTGLFRGVDRPVLSHLYPDARGRVFNLYDLAWAAGASAGPVLAIVALRLGNWRYAYALLAVSLIPVGLIILRLDLDDIAGNERTLRRADITTLLRRPEILGAAAVMTLSGGIEGGLFTWLPYYANQTLPQDVASLTLSVFLVAYVPARLLYSRLAERVGYLPLVITLTALAIPVAAVTFRYLDGLAFVAGIGLFGFLWAGVFPTVAAFSIEAAPAYSGPVNAVATGATYLGTGLVPVVMGVVADEFDIGLSMQLLTLLVVGTVLLLLATKSATAAARAESTTTDA